MMIVLITNADRREKKKNILLGPPLGLWEIFAGLVDEEDKMCVIFIFVFRDQTHIARFIWNAEISVSVAIHCYESLF